MNEIGIMQGRLLPRIGDRIQAFPWDAWPNEFPIAHRLGFDAIEFIFEGPNPSRHPLLRPDKQRQIRELVERTGVRVPSVCGDYFMDEPLFRGSPPEREARLDTLRRLIGGAAAVGARRVEIPCVDHASLRSEEEQEALVEALRAALDETERWGIDLLLEADLPPAAFRALLERAGHPMILANYDTGNSASLGYDSREEITTLANFIGNIHIKDRVRGGATVPLGTGNADFPTIFSTLSAIGYTGPLVLQTARDPDDVGVATHYLAMVREWVQAYLNPS